MTQTKKIIIILLSIAAAIFVAGLTTFIVLSQTNNATNSAIGVPLLILMATMFVPLIFCAIAYFVWQKRPETYDEKPQKDSEEKTA